MTGTALLPKASEEECMWLSPGTLKEKDEGGFSASKIEGFYKK